MINSLSIQIIKYMINKLPSYLEINVIKTDSDGIIIDWYGDFIDYFKERLQKGKDISEIFNVFYGLIPPVVNPMILQKIQIVKDKFYDIHIVIDVEGFYWIFFVDQSKES